MSGSNPDQLWNLVPNGPAPMTGQEQILAAQDASPTAPIKRYSVNMLPGGGGGGGGGGDANSFSLMAYIIALTPTATRPDGLDCTVPFQNMIADITANSLAGRHSIAILPAGNIALSSLSGPVTGVILIPSDTTIKGQGMNSTSITWNDNPATFNLFNAPNNNTGSTTAWNNISFEDLTIVGSALANFQAGTSRGTPLIFGSVNNLSFMRVRSFGSRGFGMAARECLNVQAIDCEFAFTAGGAIDFSTCSLVKVDGCKIYHCGDDAIAIHSAQLAPSDMWGVRRDWIVTNNIIFDSSGISILAPRNGLCANNMLDCIHSHGIAYQDSISTGPVGQGAAATMEAMICNNVITNVFDASLIRSGEPTGANAITIAGTAAQIGGAPAIPGEATGSGVGAVVDDLWYWRSNPTTAGVAVAGTHGIIVYGNIITRNLPPGDGTANPVGGVGTAPSLFSDYGFTYTGETYGYTLPIPNGQIWMRSGFFNFATHTTPPQTTFFTESQIRFTGVAISGKIVRDVLIQNNQFRHLLAAVSLGANLMRDVIVSNNHISDCWGQAVAAGLGAITVNNNTNVHRIYINDNVIDVDPYQKNANRGPNGTWNFDTGQRPAAIWVQSGSGIIMQRNRARNCYTPVIALGGGLTQQSDNWMECDPGITTAGVSKGIRQLPTAGGWSLVYIDGDPGSPTYGAILGTPMPSVSNASPSGGVWRTGDRVNIGLPRADGNGWIVDGWDRLTTGTSNVGGTDWITRYVRQSSFSVTAGPTIGASDGAVGGVFVSRSNQDVYVNDGTSLYPTATLDAPPVGGVQGTLGAIIMTLAPLGPSNQVITPASVYSPPTGPDISFIAAAGTAYSPGDTLSAAISTPSFQFAVLTTTGTPGPVASGTIIPGPPYTFSSFPASPFNLTGGGGGGFQMNLPAFSPLSIGVANGGFYEDVQPGITLSPSNQGAGLYTAIMLPSTWMDYTGVHIRRGIDSLAVLYNGGTTVANGGTVTMSGTAPSIIIAPAGGTIAGCTIALVNEGTATIPAGQAFGVVIRATGGIGAVTFTSPTGKAIHNATSTLDVTQIITMSYQPAVTAWVPGVL